VRLVEHIEAPFVGRPGADELPMASDLMRDVDAAASYLQDLGGLVKELGLAAKIELDDAAAGEDRAYAQGRLMALREVVSPMQQQADRIGQ